MHQSNGNDLFGFYKLDKTLRQKKLVNMEILMEAKVLLIGFDGLGVEVLKNLLLMGVHHVDVADNEVVQERDLGVGYVFRSEDVVDPVLRNSDRILSRMSVLNKDRCIMKSLTCLPRDIKKYDLVVGCNCCRKILRWIQSGKVPFVIAQDNGLTCRMYSSIGDSFSKFQCEKVDAYIEHHPYEKRPGLMKRLNLLQGCILALSFFEEVEEDGEKENDSEILEIPSRKIPPESFCEKDFTRFEKLFKEKVEMKMFPEEDYSADEIKRFTRQFCFTCKGHSVAIQSSLGGVVSHECNQILSQSDRIGCFVFERMDILDDLLDKVILREDGFLKAGVSFTEYLEKEVFSEQPKWRRYEYQIRIFGRLFQAELMKKKLLIVGAGTTGTESLKQVSMIGCGEIRLTDMDGIETSNLSRQFFYRDEDVGKKKSLIAAREFKKMNQEISIKAETCYVEDMDVFGEKFYENDVDILMSCVDNEEARDYLGNMSILFSKPYFDSGISGYRCNAEVFHPDFTDYRPFTADIGEVEDGFDSCTIKCNPRKFSHLIAWSRKFRFPEIFGEEVLLIRKGEFRSLKYLTRRIDDIHDVICTTFLIFDQLFGHSIQEALKMNDDYLVQPRPMFTNKEDFDFSDEEFVLFFKSTVLLLCETFGFLDDPERNKLSLKEEDESYLRGFLMSAMKNGEEAIQSLDIYSPKKKWGIVKGDDEEKRRVGNTTETKAIEYDKDNDVCVQFVTSAANLRMRNFRLKFRQKPETEGASEKDFALVEIYDETGKDGDDFPYTNISKSLGRDLSAKIIPTVITTSSVSQGFLFLLYYRYIRNILIYPITKEMQMYKCEDLCLSPFDMGNYVHFGNGGWVKTVILREKTTGKPYMGDIIEKYRKGQFGGPILEVFMGMRDNSSYKLFSKYYFGGGGDLNYDLYEKLLEMNKGSALYFRMKKKKKKKMEVKEVQIIGEERDVWAWKKYLISFKRKICDGVFVMEPVLFVVEE